MPQPPSIRRAKAGDAGLRWDAIPLKEYKEEGTHFRAITRQTLFEDALSSQLRYFEVQPGGYSTFERHQHVHAVLVLEGEGQVIVGEEQHAIGPRDLVYVPPATWHQFLATGDAPLGFLCLVECDRDRPTRPTPEEVESLKAHPVWGGTARF